MWTTFVLLVLCSDQLLPVSAGQHHGHQGTKKLDKALGEWESEHRDDLLFFNRVPKVGSQMMMALLSRLSVQNKFDFHRDGIHKFLNLRLTLKEENKLANLLQLIPTPAVYTKHVPFVNFTRSHLPYPIYINMVRHPVERVVSWFYYIRIPKIQEHFKLLNPTQNVSDAWMNKNFETCVKDKDPECRFLAGDESKNHGNAWSQMSFYCGMENGCSEPDGSWALARAKSNVEKAYTVVGVLEDLPTSLRVFEAKIPRFFKGATKVYEQHESNLAIKNKNSDKPLISEEVKDYIKQGLPNEMEFYEFCKQRLASQDSNYEYENEEIEKY